MFLRGKYYLFKLVDEEQSRLIIKLVSLYLWLPSGKKNTRFFCVLNFLKIAYPCIPYHFNMARSKPCLYGVCFTCGYALGSHLFYQSGDLGLSRYYVHDFLA